MSELCASRGWCLVVTAVSIAVGGAIAAAVAIVAVDGDGGR